MNMSDRHRHGPRHADPEDLLRSERGRRALAAMATAAHRAAEQRVEPTRDDPAPLAASAPSQGAGAGARRWLLAAVVVIAVLDATALAAAVALRTRTASPRDTASLHAASGNETGGGATVRRAPTSSDHHDRGSTSAPPSGAAPASMAHPAPAVAATASPGAGTAGGGSGSPHISSLASSAGAPGDTVVVTGSAFYSPNGAVTAYFDGHPASTSCPSQNACTVTVPDLGTAPSTLTLTLVTATGTSNGMPFSYQ